MQHLPAYINAIFILTTFLTLFLLYKSTRFSKPVLLIAALWLALQAVISVTGFYTNTSSIPPRFPLLLAPPALLLIVLSLTRKGKRFMDGLDAGTLTLLHVVRVPVELTLFWLYQHKAVPQIMTFEGQNFDILCGLTAPVIYYFGYVKTVLGKKTLIAWNILCLLLLANIVITAVLSAPLPFQQLAFDQPNVAVLYFPFTWLPGFIVPVVVLAHIASLRQLLYRTGKTN